MGAGNAAREFGAALRQTPERERPEWVITGGFAGGLDPRWRTGSVLFSADPDFPLVGALERAGAHRATFHCAPRVAITRSEKARLRQATGAGAVEMESEVIRQQAAAAGIPSATVRVISDAADEDLPLDFNALMNARMELDFTRLAFRLLRSPGRLPALIRFGSRSQRAARQLARTLKTALG
jgi:nucleoside phosphorylase